MANLHAIHSVGSSIVRYLRNVYPEPLRTDHACDFRLISSGELAGNEEFGTMLSFFLYRITINEHLRNRQRIGSFADHIPPLSLDLHYLVSIWATSPLTEQVVLAWTMNHLHQHPILDASSLSPEGGWQAGDFIHIIPAELSNEDIMRIWDALDPAYRLSVSYIARAVRIDPDDATTLMPVVATRFGWEEHSS